MAAYRRSRAPAPWLSRRRPRHEYDLRARDRKEGSDLQGSDPWSDPWLQDCRLAEEGFRLGEEVGHGLHLELRPEDELLRPLGHLQQEMDARVPRELPHQRCELAHDAGPRRARVDLQRHVP